jgi:hypothetical protein
MRVCVSVCACKCVLGVRFHACNTLACAVKRGISMRVCVSVCACECVLGVRLHACNTFARACQVKGGAKR